MHKTIRQISGLSMAGGFRELTDEDLAMVSGGTTTPSVTVHTHLPTHHHSTVVHQHKTLHHVHTLGVPHDHPHSVVTTSHE